MASYILGHAGGVSVITEKYYRLRSSQFKEIAEYDLADVEELIFDRSHDLDELEYVFGAASPADRVQYPDGTSISISIPITDDHDSPGAEAYASSCNDGDVLIHLIEYDYTDDGWERWQKYTIETEAPFDPALLEVVWDGGLIEGYLYDGESAVTDDNWSLSGESSELAVYLKVDGALQQIDSETLFTMINA